MDFWQTVALVCLSKRERAMLSKSPLDYLAGLVGNAVRSEQRQTALIAAAVQVEPAHWIGSDAEDVFGSYVPDEDRDRVRLYYSTRPESTPERRRLRRYVASVIERIRDRLRP